MSGSADRLLRLIYEWLEEAEECSSNLRGLARELESLREDCNAWETVGSTLAVAGSVLSIGAAFFTGGASLALLGAVGGGVGAGISVVTKITEEFKSSSKLDKVKKIDKKCNEITEKIQELFDKLRRDCPSSKADEQDQYVVKEFLKAMSRRSGIDDEIDIKDLDDLIRVLMDNALVKAVTRSLATSLLHEVISVLSAFSFQLEGKLLSAAAAKGGEQIGKAVAIRGVSRFLGGVVGLAFSLPEAIDNWTEAIKDNHETKASKSLRDTAKKITETAENLSNKLHQIQKILKQEVKSRPPPPPPPPPQPPSSSNSSNSSSSSSSSSSSDEDEDELKMALLNAHSVYKFARERNDALRRMILNNNLDVLLITETWLPLRTLRNDAFRNILPPNYNFLNDPRFYGRAGGVAIVFSNEFECEQVYFDFTFHFEYLAASLTRPQSLEPILILTIYRPPKTSLPDFLEELRKLLLRVSVRYTFVVIGGDFNIWVDCSDSGAPRTFLKLLKLMNLVQHVTEPTHEKGHTLDLVITCNNVRVTGLSVQPNNFSDHSTVFFTARYQNQRPLHLIKKMLRKRKDKKKKKVRRNNK